MNKIIVMDFDGIFSDRYMYQHIATPGEDSRVEKTIKSFGFGGRHSFEMLAYFGYEFHVITGDSTEIGQGITRKFLEKLNITSLITCKSHEKLRILKKKFNLNDIIYVGDDLYDIEIFDQVRLGYSISEAPIMNGRASINLTSGPYTLVELAKSILDLDFADSIYTPENIFVHKKHQESFSSFLQDKRYQNIFILQQYSMRNHSDGLYNPLLDGNLNLTLHRLSFIQDKEVVVTISRPENIDTNQLNLLARFIESNEFLPTIKFVPMAYGINALANRTEVVAQNYAMIEALSTEADLFISDFENASRIDKSTIYNFNISKVSNNPRSYIDKSFDKQLWQVKKAKYTYVLNENQKAEFINSVASPKSKKNIDSRVIVDSEQFNKKFFESQIKFFAGYANTEGVDQQLDEFDGKDIILFPFRLSDPCYNIQGVIETAKADYKNPIILTTDPNESNLVLDPIVHKLSLGTGIGKKANYLYLISALFSKGNFEVICFENPKDVLHQALIELSVFGDIRYVANGMQNRECINNCISIGK